MPTKPTPVPEPLARLERLEDVLVAFVAFSVDNDRRRLSRSLKAPTSGRQVEDFLDALAAERAGTEVPQ
jgi:hypothetical protein